MADWAGLPRELIFSLAERMGSLEEFIVFGAVCKSWRSVATKENYFTSELGPKHQVPLLILPQEKGAATRKCYNLKKRKICELNLSELEDKLFLSSLGWLLTISKKDLKFSLIHPLNHARIELPRPVPNMAPNLLSNFSIRKFVLSTSPSWTSNFIVMVYQSQTVSFCRPGHSEHWIRVCLHTPGILNDLTYYEGQLYAVNYYGHVFICDIEDPKQAEVRIVAPEFPKEYLGPMMQIKVAYLVESVGDLLVVLCFFNPKTKFHATTGCRVFKVPFSDGNSWLDSEVKNLGNRSLFLCRNASSFSVEASDCSGWKPNCIYFMNNERVHLRVDMDMGIFNMDDGQIERPFDNSFNICYKGRHPQCATVQPPPLPSDGHAITHCAWKLNWSPVVPGKCCSFHLCWQPSTSFLSLVCPLVKLFSIGDPSQTWNFYFAVYGPALYLHLVYLGLIPVGILISIKGFGQFYLGSSSAFVCI